MKIHFLKIKQGLFICFDKNKHSCIMIFPTKSKGRVKLKTYKGVEITDLKPGRRIFILPDKGKALISHRIKVSSLSGDFTIVLSHKQKP